MSRTVAFIHTAPVLAPTFAQLSSELLGDTRVFHMVDESLIRNTISAGQLTKATARRVFRAIESAQEAGAGIVLVTCSSIGKAVEWARPLIDIPVLRVDEPMAAAAVETGTRIGVAATLSTTLEPTLRLLQETAERRRKTVEIRPCLCEGAFEALLAGKPEQHDEAVSKALQDLAAGVDVVVLAQASMARVVPGLPAGGAPILSSPRLAVEALRRLLAGSPDAECGHAA